MDAKNWTWVPVGCAFNCCAISGPHAALCDRRPSLGPSLSVWINCSRGSHGRVILHHCDCGSAPRSPFQLAHTGVVSYLGLLLWMDGWLFSEPSFCVGVLFQASWHTPRAELLAHMVTMLSQKSSECFPKQLFLFLNQKIMHSHHKNKVTTQAKYTWPLDHSPFFSRMTFHFVTH